MKVIHVTYAAQRYGIGTFLIDLIECQKDLFGDLQVGVAFHADGPCIEKYRNSGVPVYSLGHNTAKDIRAIPQLYKIFKKYDIVNLHSSSPWALLAAILAGKKIIYTFHGAFGFRNRWTDILLRIYYRTLFNHNCQKITFASEISLSRYIDIIGCNLNNKKIELFPYGLHIKKIIPSKKREGVRAELKLNENFVIGTAARMDPIKKIERLIDAFAMLPKGDNFKLLIIGSGDEIYQKQLISHVKNYQIEDCVCFMGYRSDVLDIVNALDLFVLPSNHETFGLALLEAMSLGTPSVVFEDGGGAVDIIGESGFVVENPKELSDVILNLKDDSLLRESVARKVRERARLFDIKHTAENLYRIYTSLFKS